MKGRLDAAQRFHLQGELAEAENLYREVLRVKPDAAEAIRGLGALAYQDGRVDEAMTLFSRGVSAYPEAADLHGNLAETLRILKRTAEAWAHVGTALVLDPSLPDAWNTKGLIAQEQGRLNDALAAFREAIRLRPSFASAHCNLGNVFRALRDLDQARESLQTAVRLEPANPAALTSLGLVLLESGDLRLLDEAEALCRRALAIAPGLTAAMNNLGSVFHQKGRLDYALFWYDHAVQLDPSRDTTCHNIGKVLQERGRFDEAAAWFEKARAINDDPARYHASSGSLSLARGRHEESAGAYRLALAIDPESAEAHQGLALALHEQGRLDEAEIHLSEASRIDSSLSAPQVWLARIFAERGEIDQSCQQARAALARWPHLADAYVQLALNLRGQLPDAEAQAIENLAQHPYLSDEARSLLLFGLAGVLDARGDYPAAAARLKTANAMQASAHAARGALDDSDQHTRFVDRLITSFTPEFFASRAGWGQPHRLPVFVVGLPRSGTTLIEQVLASHPSVHGAGERPDVRNIFQSLPALVGRPGADACDTLADLNRVSAIEVGTHYLNRLKQLAAATALRVIDKMPDNLDLIGLIAVLWPGARIIVCHRDLRDVATSCWQTGFASIRWANDFEHIATRFADHERILEHWRRTRPIDWLDVHYEDTVRDLETQARRLIEFLELEWDEACLQFHRTRRPVQTASHIQVRDPIHSRSVARWRRYEEPLAPLFAALRRRGLI